MRFISKLLPASKWKLVISNIGILALIVFSALVVYETTKAEVVLVENGKEESIKTHVHTVEELLEEVGINVQEHDELSHNLDASIKDGMTINYEAAKQITVTIDGKDHTYYTTADTVEEFFSAEGLSFSQGDDISHEQSDKIKDGLAININREFEVTVNNGGKEVKVPTTGGTVEELLELNNISLKKEDRVEPALDEQVTNDTTISIVRVKTEEEEVTEKIAYETIKEKDNTLEKGQEKVITEGQEGTIKKKYKVTYENGEEVDRELLDEEVTESVNQVVAVGTKEPKQNLVTLSSSSNGNKSSNSSSGGKTFTMTASAFTATCNGCSGSTATGINLKANPNAKVIAVDPNVIPLGTKVWVEGYGEAVAGDTGGNIRGNRIDVHVPSKSAAYQWGVRKVQVKILD